MFVYDWTAMYILPAESDFPNDSGGSKMGFFASVIAVFSRIAFRFEFFFPKFIGYYISQKLKEYKQKGWIEDYKVKSKRKEKYHYFFDLELFLKIGKGGEILWLKKRKDM